MRKNFEIIVIRHNFFFNQQRINKNKRNKFCKERKKEIIGVSLNNTI